MRLVSQSGFSSSKSEVSVSELEGLASKVSAACFRSWLTNQGMTPEVP